MQEAMRRGIDALGVIHEHACPVDAPSVKLDLCDSRAVMSLVRDVRPAAIIHAGALTSPDRCEQLPNEASAVNATAAGVLAMAAFAADAHLTFVSTDLVFRGDIGMYAETDQPEPINHYARTKAQAEHFVRAANPDFAVVRPSFIYGEPLAEHHGSFSHALFRNLTLGVHTTVFHDQFRSPIPAHALAAALLEISSERMSGVWHVAGPERVSRAEFARELARVAGLDPAPLEEISMDDVALPAPRPRDVSLNTVKARLRLQTTLPSLTDGFHFLYGKGG
jgi:dTDP-4-dehydrorhamnose reductase